MEKKKEATVLWNNKCRRPFLRRNSHGLVTPVTDMFMVIPVYSEIIMDAPSTDPLYSPASFPLNKPKQKANIYEKASSLGG